MKSPKPPTKTEQRKANAFAVQSISPKWVTSDLASQLFGCPKRIIHDWIKRGEIIASKPNGRNGIVFIDVDSVNRFLGRYS